MMMTTFSKAVVSGTNSITVNGSSGLRIRDYPSKIERKIPSLGLLFMFRQALEKSDFHGPSVIKAPSHQKPASKGSLSPAIP